MKFQFLTCHSGITHWGKKAQFFQKITKTFLFFMLGFETRTQKRSLILSGFEPLTSDIFNTF